MTISSGTIVELLRVKHAKDVFVTECKDGPSQSASHSRLDVWAMKKSWANPLSVGYEIKVSRGDFLQDNKWRSYLPCCNEFSFVAPKGLIKVDELSAECGLIELVGTSRLVTRKRAPYRQIEPPETLYRYLLMCRAKITREWHDQQQSKADRLREWLACKDENQQLAWEVSNAVKDHVRKVQAKNDELTKRMCEYDEVKAFLKEIGLDPERLGWRPKWTVEERYKLLTDLVPDKLRSAIRETRHTLDLLDKEFEKLKSKQ